MEGGWGKGGYGGSPNAEAGRCINKEHAVSKKFPVLIL
jgi:hypothetical protein